MPLPDLEILGHGVVKAPYSGEQVRPIEEFARSLRERRFGVDWEQIGKTPTWVVPGSGVKVQHPRWEQHLEELAAKAGSYLGFGKAKLETRLEGLYLWQEGSIWRDYHNDLYDQTRIGTLLIVLNRDHEGGEIAVGCVGKEKFFDSGMLSRGRFWVASHNRAKHEVLPLTAGDRLGLAYDLRVDTTNIPIPSGRNSNKPSPAPTAGLLIAHELVEAQSAAEDNLFYNIACWAEALESRRCAYHPLLFVLDKTYPNEHMRWKLICPEDRARALAVMNMQRERFGEGEVKWRLRAYLVNPTATVRDWDYDAENGGRVVPGKRVKIDVDRVTDLEGTEVGPEVVGGVDERCVVDGEQGEFEGGERKEMMVLGTVVSTASRTRTCIMLVLEREEQEYVHHADDDDVEEE